MAATPHHATKAEPDPVLDLVRRLTRGGSQAEALHAWAEKYAKQAEAAFAAIDAEENKAAKAAAKAALKAQLDALEAA